MSYPSNGNGKWHEPSVGFDYPALEQEKHTEPEAEFWAAQAELLGDLLRWLTTPRSLGGMGARCVLLAFYLNPDIVNKSRLTEIAAMPGAPGKAALSKAMLEFQRRYELKPSAYQRLFWMRDRYRRSALVAHANAGAMRGTAP
jgi:hypothetical protein